MLTTIDGKMGQGKSTFATFSAISEQLIGGKKIFSTMHLSNATRCVICGDMHAVREINGSEYYECTAKGDTPETRVLKEVEASDVTRIEYTFLTFEDFTKLMSVAEEDPTSITNCAFILDEAYLFMSSRNSASKMNRIFNTFVVQTRKRGVNCLLYTSPSPRDS